MKFTPPVPAQGKILGREAAAALSREARENGLRVGFTSGTFDLLHAGHATYLEQARSLCDVLVVGVNDDASVKSYKGDKRPILPESDRARVVAGLGCVDVVFLFPEKNNRVNVEALKPHFYIKAGDYQAKDLSSAKYLEPWGGEVKIIPFLGGRSTTGVIEKIVDIYGHGGAAEVPVAKPEPARAVFLDRDGVINEEVEYLHEPEKFKLLPGVVEGLKLLQSHGYRLVVVTLQAGIGLGYFTREDFYRVNKRMLSLLGQAGVFLDRIYFCPHPKGDGCPCRKPEPGMLLRGKEDLNLILEGSWIIGDKTSDLEAGRRAGVKTVLVQTGHGGKDGEFSHPPDHTAPGLLEAARHITGG